MKKIYKNRVFITVFLLLLFLVLFSFFQTVDNSFKKYDAISVFFYIVAHSSLGILQIVSPIFVMICATYKIHKEFHTGFIKHKLLRMSYRKYITCQFVELMKSTWILPFSMLVLFVLCCVFTKNFDFSNAAPQILGYAPDGNPIVMNNIAIINMEFYKYPIQLMITYFLTLFFHSIFYANISFIICRKNKIFLVSLLESFLVFVIIAIISELGLQYISSFIFGIDFLVGIFNITGIWIYCDINNFLAILIYGFLLSLISFLVAKNSYKDKERLLRDCEK